MTADFNEIAASRVGLLKFNLGVQRGRSLLFALTIPVFVLGQYAGQVEGKLVPYLIYAAFSIASGFFFAAWYRRRFDKGLDFDLHRYWIPLDVLLNVVGIQLTGGINSPWWIFFLSNSSTVAFVRGKRSAWIVSIANVIVYGTMLLATGQITGVNETLFLPLFRVVFLYVSSYFLLSGIGTIQEKRIIIQTLREEERKQLEELRRVTQALDERTTELGQANHLIREADRAKSQFLANMSHELRTPMNSIIGFSEILIERLEKEITPRYIEFLRHIQSSGQHLLGIINDILDLSKIEAGRMEIFPERFEAGDAIRGVTHVMKGQAAKGQIEIEVDAQEKLTIESDLAKFKQILYNLLSNAIKFSSPRSVVTVRARLTGPNRDMLEVLVIDHGIGIAEENLELIFMEFRQVDSTARRGYGGTGLGLALVKRMTHMLGGRVGVESKEGEGSCFSLVLPVEFPGPRDTLPLDPQSMADIASGPSVLVVEDDHGAFESIRAHLHSAGYAAVQARHGDEALQLARTLQPVAITLDLIIPGIDGWEVLKRLKADDRTASIPVVIISMIDQRELGLALGAHDYFLKPVDRSHLVDRIRQLTSAQLTKPRLLIIDDDVTFHQLIEEELSRLGYEFRAAFDGASGIEMARREKPDVIVLDLMMPGMSGFEVAEILKSTKETADIPILVLTSKEVTSDDRAQLQSMIAALVQKGQSKDRLIAAIQQVERRHRQAGA